MQESRKVRTPVMEDLPLELAEVSRRIAETLARNGKQAWLVGGALRDLALGRTPIEIDMATDALPDEVESLFAGALAVGKAFGTIIVRLSDVDVEVTTFRSERGYSDGRRPDSVRYGTSAAEDAKRRDFTCNALFLDPLENELLDPVGGLTDLRSGVLRCVSDARERFQEDALRVMRLARFAAATGLDPDDESQAAAREFGPELRGVSPERSLKELTSIFRRPDASIAIQWLLDFGVLARLTGCLEEHHHQRSIAILRGLDGVIGLESGLAVMFRGLGVEGIEKLRSARQVVRAVQSIWLHLGAFDREGATRAERIRALRDPWVSAALRVARAAETAGVATYEALDLYAHEHGALNESDLHPEPLILSDDLARAGIPRGPRWGELLHEAETLQLDGVLSTRADALAWLASIE